MVYKVIGDVLTLLIPVITLIMTIIISWKEAGRFLLAYGLVSLMTFLMKSIFYAPRPNEGEGDSLRFKWSVNEGESFPSGHTSSAMAGAVYALFIDWRVGLVLLLLTFICAWTRVLVFAHFWRDVFFGSVVAQIGCGLIYWDLLNLSRITLFH